MYPVRKNITGFTLAELLMTLAIAAVLLGLAAPSFSELLKENRMSSQINNLLASLSLTRSEAITRGTTVTMCKSNNQTTCGGDWQNGWLVFVDNNNNGALNTGEQIIKVQGALSGNTTLAFNNNFLSYGHDALARGITNTIYFTLCDDRGDDNAKGLIINITGRTQQAAVSDPALATCPS